ncbi:receptor protein kinase CLAVATA1-like [Eucalyptus grandis]|uniref:receptor protein kinase CLAVATA1-like n=1 Tax=Eucalyptus grandis TaxID=71139 RepID=UPI00192E7DC5|nr:receptor protein kinase CLAVATA1-like [Eucalyptus grandis]
MVGEVGEPLLVSPNSLRTKPPCNGVFFFLLLFISASLAQSDLDVLLKLKTAMVEPPSAAIGDWVDSSSSFSPLPFPHCFFTEVTCDVGSWVVSLNITSVGLSGYIPPEIGLLRDLVNLTLATNNLTETLPPELNSPTSLRFLNLSRIFPSKVLWAISQLEELHLGNDKFTRPLPLEVARLKKLKWLDLANNYFIVLFRSATAIFLTADSVDSAAAAVAVAVADGFRSPRGTGIVARESELIASFSMFGKTLTSSS